MSAPASPPHNAALDTHQKALAVNLDPTSFGSFAEIGAGQEVARWFLRVGGASGTVAKTISAYDKEVSDDLYGSGTRYVSRPRLEAMLESEWKSLVHQVGGARAKDTRLFAFANTIAARNFAGTNDCHGWFGLRFQDRPGAEPAQILVHANLRDTSNLAQQEAVGVLGVNLVHALLNEHASPGDVPARLFDGLTVDRIEIDQIDMRGGSLAACDMPALHTALARDGRAEALTLDESGAAVAANEFLYKKALVIAPAASDPREDLSSEALAACAAELRRGVAGNADVKDVIAMRMLTVEPPTPKDAPPPPPPPPPSPASPVPGRGRGAVLVTRHRPLYRTSAFTRRYTQAPVRFAITLPALMRMFDEARYQHLEVRMLEGIARLFTLDVKVLAYPSPREALQPMLNTGAPGGWEVDGAAPMLTADRMRPAPPLRHLYEYLLGSGFLVAMPAS